MVVGACVCYLDLYATKVFGDNGGQVLYYGGSVDGIRDQIWGNAGQDFFYYDVHA